MITLWLQQAETEKEYLSNDEIKGVINGMFIVGHDTTSVSMMIALYYLARYPELQEIAREEVLCVLGNAEPLSTIPTTEKDTMETEEGLDVHAPQPTQEQLKRLNYLSAFIKESQRHCPVVSQSVPRRTTRQVTLPDGKVLDKGVMVCVDILATTRDETVWKNPDLFEPLRHLDDGHGERLREPAFHEFLPFGYGKRVCIGMNYARSQLRLVVATLLQRYRLSLPEGSPHKDELHMQPIYSLPPKDLQLVFEPLA